MELCTRDVAERVFGGRGVGFERGGTPAAAAWPQAARFDRGSHVARCTKKLTS